MKGYKVFNNDWTCKGFQYKVGETFEHEGKIEVCGSGFHFCQKANNCFNYYDFDSNNKVAEVETIGEVLTEGDKSVTNRIKIIREISWLELLELVNMGKGNTGMNNTGNGNAGNRNAGNGNAGDGNTGDGNAGDGNAGDGNAGNRNAGNGNAGNRNAGNGNAGNWNTGNWNTGYGNIVNFSSNVFSTIQEKIKIFDIETNLTMEDWLNSKAFKLINFNFKLIKWISEEDMTEKEKEENPSFETTRGYLKKYEYKEAWRNMWNEFTEDEKQIIKNIPNFNPKKFELITGIQV